MIGTAAGAVLGAVIARNPSEHEEGFNSATWMLALGALGGVIGAIGGLLSK